MQHALGRDHSPLNLSSLELSCDHALAVANDDAPLPGGPAAGAPVLRYWRAWTGALRRKHDPEALDEHTLSDIGLSRIEMLYWD